MNSVFSAALFLGLIFLSHSAQATEEMAGLERFRALFYKNARAAEMKDADIQKLIFKPRPDFFQKPLAAENAADLLNQRQAQLKDLLPSALYREGKKAPAALPSASATNPPTLIILPGVFGEFIDHIVFEEFFAKTDSRYARDWAEAAQGATDLVFDLESISEKSQKLSDLIVTASIDDAEGKPLLKAILLKHPKASLESIGTLAQAADIYKRRLDAFFQIMGDPENAYILGYSRGLNIGMEILATSFPAENSWLSGVKGLIGLGGTTYGSAAADLALDTKTVPGQIFQTIRTLAYDLEIPETEDPAVLLRNTERWAAALVELTRLATEMKSPEGLGLEKIESDEADLGFLLSSFKQMMLDEFQLDRPFAEYGKNIRRFKKFTQRSYEALESLTTKACLDWLAANTLPEHYRYYAITTVMPDPTTGKGTRSPLTGNKVAYDIQTIDYKFLRAAYYNLLDYSGLKVNDSQASLDRSPFWPELHQKANPRQKPFQAQLLGILGTDHWGMAFPVAFETAEERRSPFPRTVLLQTLGDYLREER